MVATALWRLFFAVSMRWTMSWSVPWVASVTNSEPNKAAHTVNSLSSTLLIAPQVAPYFATNSGVAGTSPFHSQSFKS
jgi:hypothetical protein